MHKTPKSKTAISKNAQNCFYKKWIMFVTMFKGRKLHLKHLNFFELTLVT